MTAPRLRGRMSAARRLVVAAVALVVLAVPAAAAAQCPRTSVADVEDEVMCPVCGTPLALATEAPQADRQRDFIVELIERCESKEEIKAALVSEFGPSVLAVPEERGFSLAAYVVPALFVLLAAAGVALAAVRWRRSRAGPGLTPAGAEAGEATRAARGPSDEDSARLEADLRRYDL